MIRSRKKLLRKEKNPFLYSVKKGGGYILLLGLVIIVGISYWNGKDGGKKKWYTVTYRSDLRLLDGAVTNGQFYTFPELSYIGPFESGFKVSKNTALYSIDGKLALRKLNQIEIVDDAARHVNISKNGTMAFYGVVNESKGTASIIFYNNNKKIQIETVEGWLNILSAGFSENEKFGAVVYETTLKHVSLSVCNHKGQIIETVTFTRSGEFDILVSNSGQVLIFMGGESYLIKDGNLQLLSSAESKQYFFIQNNRVISVKSDGLYLSTIWGEKTEKKILESESGSLAISYLSEANSFESRYRIQEMVDYAYVIDNGDIVKVEVDTGNYEKIATISGYENEPRQEEILYGSPNDFLIAPNIYFNIPMDIRNDPPYNYVFQIGGFPHMYYGYLKPGNKYEIISLRPFYENETSSQYATYSWWAYDYSDGLYLMTSSGQYLIMKDGKIREYKVENPVHSYTINPQTGESAWFTKESYDLYYREATLEKPICVEVDLLKSLGVDLYAGDYNVDIISVNSPFIYFQINRKLYKVHIKTGIITKISEGTFQIFYKWE